MSIFTPDTSIQLSGNSGVSKTYNTKDNPNLAFHSRAGIYNSADNEIKIFTNNIDALTIDANQKVICNGSLITNLAWGNINGKPTNFQSDWNSTIINKPSLFDGTWNSLSGKPTNFQSDWNSTIINKPDALVNISNIFPTSNVIINSTNLINYNNLSSKPNLSSVATSGNYNDLINKTFINNGNDIYNNNIGNVGIGITNPTSKLHLRGNFTHDYALSTNLTSFGNLIANKRPWGVYFAEDWSGTTLPDSSGNGRDATTSGTITKTTASGNGASGAITYISGGTTATISFPTGSIPTAFTILALTRYNGGTRQRIIQSRTSGINWSLGHLSGLRGLAYFVNNYYTDGAGIAGSQDDWLTSIAKSSGTIPTNILMNGIQRGAGTPNTTGGYELGVNLGITAQVSDWALSCVMIWDSALTDAEMVLLNTTIENYKSTGNSLNYELSKTFFLSEVYSLNNLYFNRELFKNNTNISNIFITSNVHSNSSNYLYNQIGNVSLTSYFDKTETSNIFPTSNVIKNSTNLINYNNLTNKPTNFQSDWLSTIINRPDALVNISNVFPTSNVIQNTQDLINYTKLAGKPTLFDGTWNSLSGKPTNFQSDWLTTISNKPSLFDGTWNSLSGKPTNFQSDWLTTITNKPTLFDGNYDNLTNKPFINSGINIYSSNTGNVGIGVQAPTYKLDVRGGNINNEFAYSTENRTDIYSLFTSKRPWGMYFAEDWSGTTLPDSSGNGRDATTSGTITKTTASGNGATGLITYISGGTSATVSFPAGSIPSTFTILGLTRYNGGTRRRILQARSTTTPSPNWLLGHYAGNRGWCYFEGWKTQTSIAGNVDDWLCIIGKNSGTTPNNILADGTGIGTTTGGTGNFNLGINLSSQWVETSDWCLSCVMIWDSALSDAEMANLNTMINTYKTSAIPIKYQLKHLFLNGDTYLNANLILENGSILNKTTGKSLVFGTENTERMRIQNDGNVCIGVSSTFRQLHIHNATAGGNTYLQMTNADTGSGVANGIFWGVNGTTKDFNIANTTGGNDIYFSVNNAEVMRIKKAGNIGIATNAPNALYKLDVNGGINATSLYVNGTAVSSYWTLSATNLYYNGSVNVSGDYYRNGTILQNHLFNNLGRTHGTFTDFNTPTDFGCHFLYSGTNGPNTNSVQYYEMTMGLGSEYTSGTGRYALQLAYNRYNEPYMSMRRMEGGSWAGWQRVYAGYADSAGSAGTLSGNPNIAGNLGIQNSSPIAMLSIGNSAVGGSSGTLTIGKNNGGGGTRHCLTGYDDSFYLRCFNDYGATNGAGTWVGQVQWSYACGGSSFIIYSNSGIYTAGYITQGSDQSLKTNINTIENALLKVLNLRGVEYTDIKFNERKIGLIAQEVEGVIPEVVMYDDKSGYKSIAYANMAGLFVNAIKELNEIVVKQTKQINFLLERIERLEKLNGIA